MHEVIPFYKKQLTRTQEGSKHLIKSNSILFYFIWITSTFDWFPLEMHYKHNMHSQFWKQCHKVATIQNKMHLWFCIYLWFLKYCSTTMHWLTLEIHHIIMQIQHWVHSPHHLIPLDKSFSSPHLFCFLAHFLLLIGASTHQRLHLCHSKSCHLACGNKWPHPKGIGHLGLTL